MRESRHRTSTPALAATYLAWSILPGGPRAASWRNLRRRPRTRDRAADRSAGLDLPGNVDRTPPEVRTPDPRRARAQRVSNVARVCPRALPNRLLPYLDYIPNAGALQKTEMALRECYGIAFYAVFGD